jgi:hypothetical protein
VYEKIIGARQNYRLPIVLINCIKKKLESKEYRHKADFMEEAILGYGNNAKTPSKAAQLATELRNLGFTPKDPAFIWRIPLKTGAKEALAAAAAITGLDEVDLLAALIRLRLHELDGKGILEGAARQTAIKKRGRPKSKR